MKKLLISAMVGLGGMLIQALIEAVIIFVVYCALLKIAFWAMPTIEKTTGIEPLFIIYGIVFIGFGLVAHGLDVLTKKIGPSPTETHHLLHSSI